MVAGHAGEEPQRSLPAGERATGQVERVGAERWLGCSAQTPELDRFVLARRRVEHGWLVVREVAEQERLADPPPTRHDELRRSVERRTPGVLQASELVTAVDQRRQRSLYGPCRTPRPVYYRHRVLQTPCTTGAVYLRACSDVPLL